MEHEPDQYVCARVRAALAEDPRVNQLDLRVRLIDQTLYVSGDVSTPQRREAVAAVAAEQAPGCTVCNETRVSSPAEPTGSEQLS